MASVLLEERLEIPLGIQSLADFRRWAFSKDFPDQGRIDYVQGRIEVDMSPEDLFCHGTPKTEIITVVNQRVKQEKSGQLFSDRTRISDLAADLSAEPDIVFVSHESIDSGRVRLVPKASGKAGRFVEIEGAVDLVVEIVSDSSQNKDRKRLPAAYFAAGVEEFWLVDARGEQLVFQIHRRGKAGFEPVAPDADGFQLSTVMSCAYRLIREKDSRGYWTYDLQQKFRNNSDESD